jgi:hypothetical protein
MATVHVVAQVTSNLIHVLGKGLDNEACFILKAIAKCCIYMAVWGRRVQGKEFAIIFPHLSFYDIYCVPTRIWDRITRIMWCGTVAERNQLLLWRPVLVINSRYNAKQVLFYLLFHPHISQ